MKRLWKIKKDSEAVSPVIATILMVAITVVLAAVLLVLVLNIGEDAQTINASINASAANDNVTVTFLSENLDEANTNITINGDADGDGSWNLTTADIIQQQDRYEVSLSPGDQVNLVYDGSLLASDTA